VNKPKLTRTPVLVKSEFTPGGEFRRDKPDCCYTSSAVASVGRDFGDTTSLTLTLSPRRGDNLRPVSVCSMIFLPIPLHDIP